MHNTSWFDNLHLKSIKKIANRYRQQRQNTVVKLKIYKIINTIALSVKYLSGQLPSF